MNRRIKAHGDVSFISSTNELIYIPKGTKVKTSDGDEFVTTEDRVIPPNQRLKDKVMSWLVCLIPRRVCRWLWELEDFPLGGWAPHILGRVLGVDPVRVKQ